MPEIQRKWYTEYPYLSCDIPYTLFKTPLNTEYTKTLADPDPCLLVRVHVSRRLRKGKHNYQNGACQYAYAKIIKVIFFPFALSLIKIHPCRPHKRRGNVRKNTQVRKKGLQSLKSNDDIVPIDGSLIKYISSFLRRGIDRSRAWRMQYKEWTFYHLGEKVSLPPSILMHFLQICRTYYLKINAL